MKTGFIAALFMMFLLNSLGAMAVLQVTAFSCSGETGTVNIAVGDNLNCQATIYNPDTSSTSLSTVTLRVEGSWAESVSYTGSGFSTTINNGASTTASFSDIRSTSSGVNQFSSILLDSVSDTYVADTTINVIDIKSLTNTTNVTWAREGGVFEVSANVVAGGNNVNIDLNISTNSTTPEAKGFPVTAGETRCSLLNLTNSGSAGNATQNLGTLNDGNSASNPQKWMIVMGSTDCNFTITAKGIAGAATYVQSITGTVYNSSTGAQVQQSNNNNNGASSSSSGGGGGGGGGGGTSLASESVVVPLIPLGFTGVFVYKKSAEISVFEIEAVPVSEAVQASVTVKEAALASGQEVPVKKEEGSVFKYISIVTGNIGGVRNVSIKFKVPVSWFVNNSLDPRTVELARLKNGSWTRLPTKQLSSDSSYNYFSSESPGFSIFAVIAGKASSTAAPKEDLSVEAGGEVKGEEAAEKPVERKSKDVVKDISIPLVSERVGRGNALAAALLVLVVLGVVLFFARRRFMKKN
ncbi:PGF-pre-PGF domain-containing protein [Candidatus Woesearchaeota archaeon]|nr:PGF-pre-PGF domain-containing protein [Candidatus Woesearchaeota archaeon]